MAITSFVPEKKSNRSTILIYVFALLGVGLLVYLGTNVFKNIGFIKGKAGFVVTTLNSEGNIYLNDELLGKTPYESEEIKSGKNKLTLTNGDRKYEISINFVPNTQVVLNRDLGVSDVFSSGQNFWIEKSSSDTVLSVISEPADAKVYIDNTEVGSTPYSSGDLSNGEYDLRVEKFGAEPQSSRIKIENGFKLNVSAKLFPLPVPSAVSLLDGSDSIYDIYSGATFVVAVPDNWAEAVIYWNRTRGINLAGAGVNREPVFDFLVDYLGNVYDANGKKVDDLTTLGDVTTGAYLRKVSDGEGVSEAAATALESINIAAGKKATVLPTGLGYLNVRSEPSLDGEIVTTVNVGEKFTVLEESTGWIKIRVDSETEGWTSSTYLETN